jgi:hypothetical protein
LVTKDLKIVQDVDENIIAFGYIEAFQQLYETQKSSLENLEITL